MANLRPTSDKPGLHVVKPDRDTPATGSAVCHCGASATANGDTQVKALVEGWTANHGPAHGRERQ